MARRGKKKKSLARRIRRLLFLTSAAVAIVRFAMARRPKPRPQTTGVSDWAPLRSVADRAERPAAVPVETDDAPSTPLATASVTGSSLPDWVDPVDGACPASHPVKGNGNSRIYHVPGGRFYDSTVPERCYRDPAAAEADGMRASKR